MRSVVEGKFFGIEERPKEIRQDLVGFCLAEYLIDLVEFRGGWSARHRCEIKLFHQSIAVRLGPQEPLQTPVFRSQFVGSLFAILQMEKLRQGDLAAAFTGARGDAITAAKKTEKITTHIRFGQLNRPQSQRKPAIEPATSRFGDRRSASVHFLRPP